MNFSLIIGLVRDRDSIWLLVRSRIDSARNTLVHYSQSTGIWTVSTIEGVEQIAYYKPDQVLVYASGSISTYTLGSNLLGECITLADSPPSPFAYDEMNDRLFYLYQGDIYQKRIGQEAELLRVMDTTFFRHDEDSDFWDDESPYSFLENEYDSYLVEKTPVKTLLPLPNGQPLYGQPLYGRSELYYVINTEPIIGNMETLHINGYADLLSNSFYMLTHPNVQIEQCFFNNKLIEHPVDLVFFYVYDSLPRDMAEGTIQALPESDVISQRLTSYIPQIQEAITIDGKPMGLPTYLWFRIWQYDQEKWNEIGLPDPPRTVDELFNLIMLWDTQYAGQYPNQELLGSGALMNYKSALLMTIIDLYTNEYATEKEPFSFDTPEFRNLLERIIAAPDLPTDEWGALLRDRAAFDRIYYYVALVDENGGLPEFKSILPPQLYTDRPVKIPATLKMLCISGSAPSPDLAMEYLTFMAEFQTVYQPEITFMMTGGVEPQPVFHTRHPAFQVSSVLEFGLTDDGMSFFDKVGCTNMSMATLDFYKQAAPYLTFHDIYIIDDDIAYGSFLPWKESPEQTEEPISVDVFIRMLDIAIKMK